jgi:hypothetical protein
MKRLWSDSSKDPVLTFKRAKHAGVSDELGGDEAVLFNRVVEVNDNCQARQAQVACQTEAG